MFRAHVLTIRRSKLHYTASDIITPIGGRLLHGLREDCSPRRLFTTGEDPVPILQEAVCAQGPVWTGAENLASTGIQSPDRPARSQSLYRLSYPAHLQ